MIRHLGSRAVSQDVTWDHWVDWKEAGSVVIDGASFFNEF